MYLVSLPDPELERQFLAVFTKCGGSEMKKMYLCVSLYGIRVRVLYCGGTDSSASPGGLGGGSFGHLGRRVLATWAPRKQRHYRLPNLHPVATQNVLLSMSETPGAFMAIK